MSDYVIQDEWRIFFRNILGVLRLDYGWVICGWGSRLKQRYDKWLKDQRERLVVEGEPGLVEGKPEPGMSNSKRFFRG